MKERKTEIAPSVDCAKYYSPGGSPVAVKTPILDHLRPSILVISVTCDIPEIYP